MKKNVKINYLSKDFQSLKADLEEHAKRYYPTTLGDLSDASINSFFIESAAYVGDVLSYYLDYQANESFLETAIETNNILKLAKSIGYKESPTSTTIGKVTFYILIPANDSGTPDFSKTLTINRGTELATSNDSSTFIVSEDVEISDYTVGSNYVVAKTNSVGVPTFFAVKVTAPIISGKLLQEDFPIGSFQKFRKLFLNDPRTVEIVSVVDAENNIYYEVSNLSQNIIYKSFSNTDEQTSAFPKNVLKTIAAPRRFVFSFDNGIPYLMFGGKQIIEDENLIANPVSEPQKFIINKYNNDFLQDSYFEPNYLLNGDNFGVGPSNTVLTIVYRANASDNNNVTVGNLNAVKNFLYSFKNESNIDGTTKQTIINSIQVINEEPIVGDSVSLSSDEIKNIAGLINQSQGRAVTSKDYEALVYMMPPKFGSIKKCRAERDPRSLKNNINLYVVCSNEFDFLSRANSRIKENIKFWLSQYKGITDSVDILDAKIINLAIEYSILVDPNYNKIQVKDLVDRQLRFIYSFKPEIGQSFSKLDVYREIQKVKGVLDIKRVDITNKTGNGYSQTPFNVEQNTSEDGNMIMIPRNAIYEIKILQRDIIGKVE